MRVHNQIPLLLECLERWTSPPSPQQFGREYSEPMAAVADRFFTGFSDVILDLNWESYRTEALRLDPVNEEKRLLGHLKDVERLMGFSLEGEVILCGAFTAMDGFARFDQGRHKVFLGVDESHGRGRYLDVLETHELTHVARGRGPRFGRVGAGPKDVAPEFLGFRFRH